MFKIKESPGVSVILATAVALIQEYFSLDSESDRMWIGLTVI
jgi:hypothetical protein